MPRTELHSRERKASERPSLDSIQVLHSHLQPWSRDSTKGLMSVRQRVRRTRRSSTKLVSDRALIVPAITTWNRSYQARLENRPFFAFSWYQTRV